ncbi:MAG: DEAD/DEAH box helicase [Saprospiraceae bacterium]|nr:DEAD/DEAH box helicase [Saprospiraceae bacterium]
MRLNKALFTLLDDLKEIQISVNKEVPTCEIIDYQPSVHLKANLRPYQLEGVKWLIQHYQQGFGACLADDMGLGKTLQTIAALLYVKENGALSTASNATTQLNIFEQTYQQDYYQSLHALIILPASLVFNWEKELKTFAPHLMRLKYIGSKRKVHEKLLHRFDVVLTTYQTALKDKDILKKYQFECIVLDESQHIKNKSSQVFKAINELKAGYKISLSGTPIENSLADIWSQMQFINPTLLGSFNFFQKHFITPIEKQRNELRTEDLRRIVQPFLLRRTKQAVAKDLPALSTQVVYIDMSEEQEKIYEREKSAVRNHLLEHYQLGDFTYRSLVLQSLTKLRLIANHPILSVPTFEGSSGKFSYILHQLDIIRKSGHKVLVFSAFTKHLALFEQELMQQGATYCKLTGQDSALQRDKAVEEFQNNSSISTFLISLKAGGTGLNLTAADYVFILDPWWNPNAEDQAIARAHRIGQTRPVFATKFIAKDTIEEKNTHASRPQTPIGR